jgi:hypothetical protein
MRRSRLCREGSISATGVIGTIHLLLLAVMLSAACVLVLGGCQSPKAGLPSASSAGESTRNNSYSLLYQLLSEQKNVSLLLLIKREQNDVKSLIKKISVASSTGAKLLEEFAKKDPAIKLNDIRLPPGEVATREAIASTKKKELLGRQGEEFERTLLLTQIQALSYACQLAKVAGENESQPERASALASLSKDMENLHHEVLVLLFSKSK